MGKSSDTKINYSLRPSKSIERKMLLEVLKEICPPSVAHEYQYIGFGACFFTDFRVFHRGLNIEDMYSIESKKANEARVNFNKPYSCVKVLIDRSTQALPKIAWKKKSIVWLDYETALKDYMFEDIEICSRNFLKNSVIIVSLRRDFDQEEVDDFNSEFGENAYAGIIKEDIQPAKSANTINKMFLNKINETLSEKYAATDDAEKIIFKQLFDLTYKDDAKMYTFGGVFLKKDEEIDFLKYQLNKLEFVGKTDKPFDITFPIVTNKELHLLNSLLPSEKQFYLEADEINFIPSEHRSNYYNTYKYYPAYQEMMDI